jgi:hypothetical protein
MIPDSIHNTLVEQIIKELIGQGEKGLKPVLEMLFNSNRAGAVFRCCPSRTV